jgi:hypothetical protein
VSKNKDISEVQVQRALWGFWNWSYPRGYTSGGTLSDTPPPQLLATQRAEALTAQFRAEGMPSREAMQRASAIVSFPSYTYDQAYKHLFRYSDSFSRLGMILGYVLLMADTDEWLRLLGENWSCCDNISEHIDDLRVLIPQNGPCLQMMDEDEQRRWKELPEIVTIYRGCGARNIHGICWTLDRAVAGEFPTLNRYKVEDPLLVTATVSKRDIVALKLGREEEEVITFRPRIVRIEKLSGRKG